MRLIDADALKNHYSWWEGGTKENTLDEQKEIFDTIVDLQPTIDPLKQKKRGELAKMMDQVENQLIKAVEEKKDMGLVVALRAIRALMEEELRHEAIQTERGKTND